MDERHPDIFTDEEARQYLRLPSVQALKVSAKDYGIVKLALRSGYPLWHRADLEQMLSSARGARSETRGRGKNTHLTIAGNRS